MGDGSAEAVTRPTLLGRWIVSVRAFATVSTLGWSFVAVGILLRLVRYLDNRALFIDEAMLALNLLERGFGELLEPLDYTQAAPPGFLLLEKLAVVTFGETEYALRSVPLLAGIVALVLFRRLTALYLPGLGGLVALGLFAVSEPLVYYTAEVKQYSLDVLVAVVLLSVAAEPLATGRLTTRRAVGLASAGAAAVWFSHPAVFVLAGIAAALGAGELLARRRLSTSLVAVVVVWLVGFGCFYALFADSTSDVRAALDYGEPESGGPLRVARNAWRALAFPVGFARTQVALAVALAAFGVFSLARDRRRLLGSVALTIAAAAGAGAAGVYPFYDRFVLFLAPLVFLLVGAGIQELRDATARRTQAIWIVALAVLASYPVGVAAGRLVDPPGREELRGVLAAMEDSWRADDSIYVSLVTQSPLAYYAECEACGALDGRPQDDLRRLVLESRTREARGLRSGDRLVISDRVMDFAPYEVYASDFAQFRGRSRAWFVFSSAWRHDFALYALDCLGEMRESYSAKAAAAYLYDLDGPLDEPAECLRE